MKQPTHELQERIFDEGGSEIHLSDYLEILRRQWRLILLAGLAGIGVGLLHFFNTADTFQASTRIQITRQSSNPLGSQAYWMESWWNPEFYPTQQEILKSRGLAQRVVERLRLWEDEAYVGSAAGKGPGSAEADQAMIGSLANRVRGGLEIREVKGTQLVDIVYRAGKPEQAMRIANAYAEAFIDYGKAERRQAATSASTFLADEIDNLKTELDEKERRLQEYGRQSDIVAIDPQSNVTLQRLDSVNANLVEARKQRIQAEARYNEIRNRPRESVADSLSGGLVSTQRNQLIELQRDYTTKLKTYRPDFPTMVELKATIDEAKRELDALVEERAEQAIDDARSIFQAAQREERALAAEYEQIKQETLRFQSASVEYNNLKIEVEAGRELLNNLTRRQSETNVAVSGSDESTIRQIDVALLPGSPVSPNLRKDLGVGLLFGLFAGVGLVFLFELLDRTVKTPDELERRLGLSTLAVIPDVSGRPGYGYLSRYGYGYGYGYGANGNRKRAREAISIDLVPHHRPRLAVSEAYRALRTALLLSTADELQVVAVTSATSGEGKTTTTGNLAVVLAQLGRRVLLIDADLRKPRAHEFFQISNRVGVVNYLVGQSSLEEIVHPTEVDNLVVAPSGPSPPNPSELLSSESMSDLLREARKHYDFVLIDTPPTLAVTDSTLLGDMADGVVLCFRAGRLTREDARACTHRLRQAGVKILGSVLNGYRPLRGRLERGYSYHYEAYGEHAEQSRRDAVA
ncbi:MAG: polysaccharide biosynthesis tyrosine autokinase [Acidobacteriota bacterium]